MAEKACHVVCSTTRRGLTQALGFHMNTPTSEISNALAWLELYAHARFVEQCLPSAKYMMRLEGGIGEDLYEIRSEERSLFRFRAGDDFLYDNDVFFSLELQEIIDEITKQGGHGFYERTLKQAMAIHLERLKIKDWDTFETLHLCCKELIPLAEEAARESEPFDITWFGHQELSGLEMAADNLIRQVFDTPYPTLGKVGVWKAKVLLGAKA